MSSAAAIVCAVKRGKRQETDYPQHAECSLAQLLRAALQEQRHAFRLAPASIQGGQRRLFQEQVQVVGGVQFFFAQNTAGQAHCQGKLTHQFADTNGGAAVGGAFAAPRLEQV